jgi:ABC-type transport system involved in multi-copper enzyme maturation permease subunit
MLGRGQRVLAIAFNTYREAVRARILLGLAAMALATALYSIAVGEFALKNASRVVADLGAASISIYAILTAVILGATSLYRELEQKTIIPILARPIHRAEYIVGKYAGTLLTLAVFIALDAAAVLLILARHGGRGWWTIGASVVGLTAVPALVAWRVPRARTVLPLPWAVVALCVGLVLSSGAIDDRRVVIGSSGLAFLEIMIVSALATLFSAFSSPFLSAVFTMGIFIVGREAGTLSRLPVRVFGETLKQFGSALSRVVPHLEVYVPPRPLLTGETPGTSLLAHVGLAALQSIGWGLGLLVVSSLIFKRRDLL